MSPTLYELIAAVVVAVLGYLGGRVHGEKRNGNRGTKDNHR